MRARSLFYVRAARAPGITMKELAGRLGLAPQAVSISVRHGEELVKKFGYRRIHFFYSRKNPMGGIIEKQLKYGIIHINIPMPAIPYPAKDCLIYISNGKCYMIGNGHSRSDKIFTPFHDT